jgi:hypothetical protein
MRQGMEVHWASYGHYTTDLFSQEAVRYILQHNTTRSLFLYLAHLATHSANPYRPLQAPADTVNKFQYITSEKRRIFAGESPQTANLRGQYYLEVEKLMCGDNIDFISDVPAPIMTFLRPSLHNRFSLCGQLRQHLVCMRTT